MDSRSANSRARNLVLWAGCAVIFATGVWCAGSAASAFTNAHVRVQPRAGVHAGQMALSEARRASMAYAGPLHQSAVQGSITPTPSGATSSHSAVRPLVSASALVLALVAVATKFWKKSPAIHAISPVPMDMAMAAATGEQKQQMDEVALAMKADQEKRKTLTPKQVVLELQRGNARFWSGMPERPEMNAMERRALIMAQAPSVCILSCADSRVPVEIVFDQGLGSVFVVRVAGNILDSTAMGSIEFSVKALGVKVILVMGHEGCGAVKGAMGMTPADLDAQPAYLQSVLKSIRGNLNLDKLSKIRDSRAQDREAIVVNVSSQVKRLQENQVIGEKVSNGSLLVCGAFYEITSGIVDFFSLDKNGLVTDL